MKQERMLETQKLMEERIRLDAELGIRTRLDGSYVCDRVVGSTSHKMRSYNCLTNLMPVAERLSKTARSIVLQSSVKRSKNDGSGTERIWLCTSGSAEHEALQVKPCVQGLKFCVDGRCGGGLCVSLSARGAGREG